MTRKSSHTQTYAGLVKFAEEILKEKQDRKLLAQRNGISNLEPATEREEYAKLLVRMLRKGLPVKQTDMFTIFNQTVK